MKDQQKPTPVIIDTDFGDDPVDILALYYGLKSPEISIKAIISSNEYRGSHRAAVIKRWLEESSSDIPVFAGLERGNSGPFPLGDLYDSRYGVPGLNSGELGPILEQVAEDKGSYVSIGGLSNLSQLITNYPQLLGNMLVYVMGGAFNYRRDGAVEHNVRVDVDAARKVFFSGSEVHWVLHDHTAMPELELKPEELYFRQIMETVNNSPLLGSVKEVLGKQPDPDNPYYLDDPLTLSAAFMHTISFKQKSVFFNEKGEFIPSMDQGVPVWVSDSVNYAYFLEDFTGKLGK